jgi:hypothetical protein
MTSASGAVVPRASEAFFWSLFGTTLFFLLGSGDAKHQIWVDVIAPLPSFGIVAVIIRQGITASVRGRLLLAYERALVHEADSGSEDGLLALNSERSIPIGTSYHAQLEWLQGGTGKGLARIERAAVLIVPAVVYLAVTAIKSTVALTLTAVFDGVWLAVLLWLARDAFFDSGYARLEEKMAASVDYLLR